MLKNNLTKSLDSLTLANALDIMKNKHWKITCIKIKLHESLPCYQNVF